MSPCLAPGPSKASLARRRLLIGAVGLGLAACGKRRLITVSHTPDLRTERLNREAGALAERARPGVLGAGLVNLESGEVWSFDGQRRFPMQSVFKVVLAAAALAEVDAGRLLLTETTTITDGQLSPSWSPIADHWPSRRVYTFEDLLTAAVADSDNTAADVLMKRIGGPGAVEAWLEAKHVDEVRVDRYEREVQPDVYGMASFRPVWKGEAAFAAARATVAPERRRQAMAAHIADPRDSATPRGMATFLARLDAGELISAASTRKLLALMSQGARGGDRLEAGLPKDTTFAHKTGTSGTDQGLTPAFNDVGVLVLPDRRRYAIAAFLTGSTADAATNTALFAELGLALIHGIG
jgi:beta-lactamase class A